jgi:hypothetical protein
MLCALNTSGSLTEETNLVPSHFLQRYFLSGQEFLEHSVTEENTWICHHTQRQNTPAGNGNSPFLLNKKFKIVKSAGKVMATLFLDHSNQYSDLFYSTNIYTWPASENIPDFSDNVFCLCGTVHGFTLQLQPN